MRPYEIMIIIDSGLEDDVIRGVIDRSTKLISGAGGRVGRVDRWGRRRFAYEINKRLEGYYVVVEATAEPAVMTDLSRMLQLADEVVRYKVVRVPDKVAGRGRNAASNAGSSAPGVPAAATPTPDAPSVAVGAAAAAAAGGA